MELTVASIAVGAGVFVATIGLAVWLFVVRRYSFWRDRNVPYVEPELPYGNFKEMGKSIHPAHLSQGFYEKYKGRGGVGFVGLYIFLNPVLLVTDLRLVKRILIEDFHHFPNRGVYFNEKHDPLSAHLFALEGQRWKDLRAKITPTFTSGRMRAAFPVVCAIAEQFCDFLRERYHPSEEVVEVRDLMARFTTDVIGSYAFGLELNSFRDPQNEFRRIGRKHFDTPRNHPLKVFIMKTFRGLANKLGLKLLHDDVATFFRSVIRETIEHRERHGTQRNDFLDLLIRLKNTGSLEGSHEIVGRLSEDEIAAQAFIFFTAGFETSSSAMTYTLYELALNQAIQKRARECVLDALERHDGAVSYESSKSMLYLDQCIYETLRKYPPVAILERTVAKPYRVPDTNIVLHRGMKIMVPAYAIHHDPLIYPDPSTYDPDRFTPERMAKRDPCAYLPFGEGPRICIGLRFGMMQARIGLAMLLKHFEVLPCEETDVPLTYSPRAFVLTPVNGVRLRLVRCEAPVADENSFSPSK
uniref:Cytochrome P450 n=1 Tax=Anopheles farauti TaxID=69004 RepID=A0A182Q911_9DIPT